MKGRLGSVVLLATLRYSSAMGPTPVLLGSAANFAILATSRISTAPDSAISGDVGVSPGKLTALSGFSLVQDVSQQFWTSAQVNGRLMTATDAPPTPQLLSVAITDMRTAFSDAMGRSGPDFVGLKDGRIGGSILVPGLYKWTTGVTISTGITLSGGPTDTWIFQVSGSFNQASDVAITLLGGAVPKNIIWAIAGTVTIGANATFQGNILAKTNVDVGTHAIDNGCIYAETAVHLQQATISCSVTPPPSSSTTPPPQSSTSTATSTSTAPATTFTPPCTPTATSCFTTAFENLNASIEAGDFLTFILTDTAEECIDFCACTGGCAFANPNFDNAKNTTMLTCSIYAGCHTAAEAINTGGQTLPDGSLSTITSSSGYCLTSCGLRH